MKVVSAGFIPYKLRFRAVIKTPTGSYAHREGYILKLEDGSGRTGWGDAAPWPGFGTDLKAVHRTLDAVTREDGPLCGANFKSLEEVRAFLSARSMPAETTAAVESALLDLLAKAEGVSVSELLCDEPRQIVELHALVQDAVGAKAAVKGGARAVKLKIGSASLGDEVTRVGAVRAAIGPDVGLRLDANGAWDRDAAVRAAKALAAFSPEWIEQPVAPVDIEGLATVRREGGVAVAVDEGVQRMADLEKVIASKAADVLVVKPMYAGGILAALDLARRAHEAQMRVTVTNALESAVGRVAAMHLAACIAGPLPACGLGDPMEEDVAKAPVATGGWADIPSLVGLGVNASEWYSRNKADLGAEKATET